MTTERRVQNRAGWLEGTRLARIIEEGGFVNYVHNRRRPLSPEQKRERKKDLLLYAAVGGVLIQGADVVVSAVR